jgi:hypothetical protein
MQLTAISISRAVSDFFSLQIFTTQQSVIEQIGADPFQVDMSGIIFSEGQGVNIITSEGSLTLDQVQVQNVQATGLLSIGGTGAAVMTNVQVTGGSFTDVFTSTGAAITASGVSVSGIGVTNSVFRFDGQSRGDITTTTVSDINMSSSGGTWTAVQVANGGNVSVKAATFNNIQPMLAVLSAYAGSTLNVDQVTMDFVLGSVGNVSPGKMLKRAVFRYP